jgi:hypothetical protein
LSIEDGSCDIPFPLAFPYQILKNVITTSSNLNQNFKVLDFSVNFFDTRQKSMNFGFGFHYQNIYVEQQQSVGKSQTQQSCVVYKTPQRLKSRRIIVDITFQLLHHV